MSDFNKLVGSVFTTGNNESLATLDIYKQKAGSLSNTVAGLTESIKVDVNNIASLSSFSKEKLSEKFFKMDGIGNLKLNANALLAGITNGSSTLKSALSSLEGASKLGINSISSLQNIVRKHGDVYTKLSDGSFKNASSLISIVNTVAGINLPLGLTDKGALTSLMTGVISQAAGIGLNGLIGPFITSELGKLIGPSVVGQLANTIISKSYSSLVNEISIAGAGPQLLTNRPDFIYSFVSKYKLPKSFRSEDSLKEWDTISSALNGIDPKWVFETVNNKQYINAELIYRGSVNFKELLRLKIMSLDILRPSQAAIAATTSTVGEVVTVSNDDLKALYPFISEMGNVYEVRKELTSQFTNLYLKPA
jgi:hypothetical protein